MSTQLLAAKVIMGVLQTECQDCVTTGDTRLLFHYSHWVSLCRCVCVYLKQQCMLRKKAGVFVFVCLCLSVCVCQAQVALPMKSACVLCV